MPGGDRTGPLGLGPMSGRGMGYCTGFAAGRGAGLYGRGAGFYGSGRNWRGAGFYRPVPTKAQEAEALRQEAAFLQSQLDEIKGYLRELDKGGEGGK